MKTGAGTDACSRVRRSASRVSPSCRRVASTWTPGNRPPKGVDPDSHSGILMVVPLLFSEGALKNKSPPFGFPSNCEPTPPKKMAASQKDALMCENPGHSLAAPPPYLWEPPCGSQWAAVGLYEKSSGLRSRLTGGSIGITEIGPTTKWSRSRQRQNGLKCPTNSSGCLCKICGDCRDNIPYLPFGVAPGKHAIGPTSDVAGHSALWLYHKEGCKVAKPRVGELNGFLLAWQKGLASLLEKSVKSKAKVQTLSSAGGHVHAGPILMLCKKHCFLIRSFVSFLPSPNPVSDSPQPNQLGHFGNLPQASRNFRRLCLNMCDLPFLICGPRSQLVLSQNARPPAYKSFACGFLSIKPQSASQTDKPKTQQTNLNKPTHVPFLKTSKHQQLHPPPPKKQ